MPINTDTLQAVLDAAELVLSRREIDMLTTDEWDALQHAVAACREAPPGARQESFRVEGGALVRRVVPANGGDTYEHRCPLDSFEDVAHAIDEMGDRSFSLEDLRAATNRPWSQAAVALAFLKERGIVVAAHGRESKRAGDATHLDAVTEYHALREGPAPVDGE